MDNFGTLSSGIVTGWQRWRSGQRWHSGQRWRQMWSLLSALLAWGCTSSFGSSACLWILYGAIVWRKASIHVVSTKHGQVFLYHSLHLHMPRTVNTPLLLISDVGARFLDQILRFLHCSAWKPSIGHFGLIQGQAQVGMFQLYPTSLPWHSRSHVENLQEISCCSNNEMRLVPRPYTLCSLL